jgi:serine/threonine-protein kinase
MGVVYRAIYEKTGRPAAVKVISGEIAQGEKVRKRFEREYEILNQFRHPGIVRLLAWGKFRGTRYIAMEFVDGVTLEKSLQDRGPLPWREVVELGIQVCDALHYAHERGIVHRDLKPSNLMVTADAKVKLTDFGIAKDLDPDATPLTATGRTLGTAAYMAPEQIRGMPAVSHKTDLYALGIVLYQMLTGKPPFEGGTPVVLMHYHLNEPPPRPSAKVAEIPRALDDLVVALMAKGPADRPWDAAAVGLVLTELKEKAERGAVIPMVWPTGASASGGAARGGPGAGGTGRSDSSLTDRPRRKSRKSGSLVTLASAIFPTRSRSQPTEPVFLGLSRGALETALLVLALLGVGGFIVYSILPPGREQLYHQAEALMASTRRSDWLKARDDCLDPLDERFPDHPWREQTRKWRDKILLDEADGRANILVAPVKTRFSEPNNNAERQFVIAHTVAGEASGRRDDLSAVRQWRELANLLKPQSDDPKSDEPEERKWYVLALDRADRLENAIRDRRQTVETQLSNATKAHRAGQLDQEILIRAKLIEQYGGYTDLTDLLPAPPVAVSPTTSPQPATPPPAGAPTQADPPASPPAKPSGEKAPEHSDSTPPPEAAPCPKNDGDK